MAEKSRGNLGVLAAPRVAPRLPEEEQAPLYKRLRAQAFLGIFLGYAGYYLIRNNVSIVSADLQESRHV